MSRCRLDTSLQRKVIDGFQFPLGAYPVEDMKPRSGYTLAFEPSDGDNDAADSDWEEWPDRYVFDILISFNRVESLCRALFSLLPGRVYPILDVLGRDEYREIDPYVAYDLLGLDRFIDAVRRCREFFYEDGLVGFGAMSEEPFLYVFIDEHKIVTVRAEVPLREKVEQILAAFDLETVEAIEGADSVTHEHRGVLDAPEDRLDLLTADEIVEDLQEEWRLELNVNPDSNNDDEGNELGITGWRCLVRIDPMPPEASDEVDPAASTDDDGADESESAPSTETVGTSTNPESSAISAPARSGPKPTAGKSRAEQANAETESSANSESDSSTAAATPGPLPPSRYAEVLLTANNLTAAQDLALQAVVDLPLPGVAGDAAVPMQDDEPFIVVLNADRLRPENFIEAVRETSQQRADVESAKVWHAHWLG